MPGEIDVSGFPLFALFNAGDGRDDRDPRDGSHAAGERRSAEDRRRGEPTGRLRRRSVRPRCGTWWADSANRTGAKMPSLRRVLSAGAPVPPHVLARMKAAISPEGDVHTPYGATEALPVASISASEVLGETAARSAPGRGPAWAGSSPASSGA